jgi:hypothetical protein
MPGLRLDPPLEHQRQKQTFSGSTQLKPGDEWKTWYDTLLTCRGPAAFDTAEIIAAVCKLTRTKPDQILSKIRVQHVAMARQIVMYAIRELTGMSFPKIGDRLGRDHATVIHAHRLICRRMEKEPGFAVTMSNLLHAFDGAQPYERRIFCGNCNVRLVPEALFCHLCGAPKQPSQMLAA